MKFVTKVLSITLIYLGLINPLHASDSGIWSKVRAGEVILMIRHALAPGGGDPYNFVLRDCSTQRNLSDIGRDQARHIGSIFREQGIQAPIVYSSQWCRCLETARLMGLGTVEELSALNSFFRNFEREEEQTSALMNWVKERDRTRITILVTHQVNITSYTGIFPQSGEIIFIKPDVDGGATVVGRQKTSVDSHS